MSADQKPPSNAKQIPASESIDLLTWVFIQDMSGNDKARIKWIAGETLKKSKPKK